MRSPLSLRRFWVTNSVVALLFVINAYQLLQLTVLRQEALLHAANKQHMLNIELPALRGQIVDRSGKELAANLKVPSVYAIPRLIPKAERSRAAQDLSRVLGLDEIFIAERLSRDKSFVWLKRRISFSEANRVRKMRRPYLGILEEYRRFYPQGDLLSQILGFTNVDNAGLEGMELHLNHELHGRNGRRLTKRDALGREIKAFEIKSVPPVHGGKVTLTIDHYIQYLTERALERAYQQWNALGAMAVVMEADTGRILAIANRPNYDPNISGKSTAESRRNRAITDMYEPGSVFKIVAASAVLNEGLATSDSQFDCENGEYNYGIKVLHDVHPYGILNFEDVIVKSSNIGTVKIASLLEPDVLQHYIELFGFGRSTGIDFPGEASGFTRPPKFWSKTSPYNIPIGQEIMVTPIQMTAAMAVIANGGHLVKPYLIQKIEDASGVVLKENHPVIKHTVLHSEVAALMRKILARAVQEGTGKSARIEGIPVGGKTGTAQKILPGGRGYSHTDFMSSFFGFAPADHPKLVMGVVLDNPKPRYYGGTVAAPVFKEVIEAALISMGYIPETASKLETNSTSAGASGKAALENRPMFLPAQAAGATH